MDKSLFKTEAIFQLLLFIIKLGKMKINMQLKLKLLHQNKQIIGKMKKHKVRKQIIEFINLRNSLRK